MKIQMNGFTLHVSEGNGKIGKTMNLSLMPGRTCSAEACRTCLRGGCYAEALTRRRANVSAAWGENTVAMMALQECGDFSPFISKIVEIVRKKRPTWFRIHVGGDFFSRLYFKAWCEIAKRCPGTRFFAFTKQWDSVKGIPLPENFRLIASHWTGCVIPKWALARLPVAWLVENGKPVPVRDKVTHICPGNCSECHWCNNLSRETGDVAFPKHK